MISDMKTVIVIKFVIVLIFAFTGCMTITNTSEMTLKEKTRDEFLHTLVNYDNVGRGLDDNPSKIAANEFIRADLFINKKEFNQEDTITVTVKLNNHALTGTFDEYLLLDVHGDYSFYPSWSEYADFNSRRIASGISLDVLFSYNWPESKGSGSGIRLYYALTKPSTFDLVSNVDVVEFGFR